VSGHDIRLQRVIRSAPDDAFTHWVEPSARQRWYAPDDGWIIEAETDLRVGGAWRVLFGPSRDEMYLEHGFSRRSTGRIASSTRRSTNSPTGDQHSKHTSS
jgi:uncharacterized protein YndB with AHSA1/START domain